MLSCWVAFCTAGAVGPANEDGQDGSLQGATSPPRQRSPRQRTHALHTANSCNSSSNVHQVDDSDDHIDGDYESEEGESDACEGPASKLRKEQFIMLTMVRWVWPVSCCCTAFTLLEQKQPMLIFLAVLIFCVCVSVCLSVCLLRVVSCVSASCTGLAVCSLAAPGHQRRSTLPRNWPSGSPCTSGHRS